MILRQFNGGLKPEFGLTIGMVDVDVQPCFLPGEEKEPESVFAEDGRAQRWSL
jgi:hypothetical protein